jgi:hypothetical protein
MLLMDTPSLLNWGLRIYFYLLLIWSFNIPSIVGMVLSCAGFLIMEGFCEQLHNEYAQNYNSKLLDNLNDTAYNQILK